MPNLNRVHLFSGPDNFLSGRTTIESVTNYVYMQPYIPVNPNDDMGLYYCRVDNTSFCCIADVYNNIPNLTFNSYTLPIQTWDSTNNPPDGLDIDLNNMGYEQNSLVALVYSLNNTINNLSGNLSIGFNPFIDPSGDPNAITAGEINPPFACISGDDFSTGKVQVGTRSNGTPVYAHQFMIIVCKMGLSGADTYAGLNFNIQFINNNFGTTQNLKIDPKVKNNGTPGSGKKPPINKMKRIFPTYTH